MGKSPGKWIKTIIFGKKSSKSGSQKKTATLENEEAAAATAASSKASSIGNMESGEKSDYGLTVSLGNEIPPLSLPQKQNAPKDNGNTTTEQQEQAVTTAQANFRDYLAGYPVDEVKRLQGLIRGHLVRRQGVATLRCVQGIVRLQALFRGRRVRVSDVGREVQKKCSTLDHSRVELSGSHAVDRPDKLSSNAFITKLLASSPTALPLHLNYDKMEPNCTWQWLERWSSSKFWELLPQPKSSINKKSNKKGNIQIKNAELGRQKKVEGWVSTPKNRKHLLDQSPAYENQINNRRMSEAKGESAGQEHPKNELERVKQNLRRISASSKAVLACSESVVEMPKLISKMVSSSSTSEVPERSVDKSFEKAIDSPVAVSKSLVENPVEMAPKTIATMEKIDKTYGDHVAVEKPPIEYVEKVEDVPEEVEERIYMEEKTSIMDFQVRSNKRNLPGKLEFPESVSQRGPSLPNYMAATESAKVKLRGFSTPRFDKDEIENVSLQRRNSLPLSSGGKFSLTSSQNGRLVQASARGESKSLLSYINGHDKGARPGWKR